jgi:DNA adenine methylase
MPVKATRGAVLGGARSLPLLEERQHAKTESMNGIPVRFLRYPGGKQRLLHRLMNHLPHKASIKGRLVEPFVGSGAIFFAINPGKALLADLNTELIDLFRGIRRYPAEIWKRFSEFPSSKEGYYEVRSLDHEDLDLAGKAARTLYLSRTCFKGMWRHNSSGQFNVGYGGQDRRWAICRDSLAEVSRRLNKAVLRCCDFAEIISECTEEDYLFLDPPYKPGERDIFNDHYSWSRFRYADHVRLATLLQGATEKGVRWAMTTTSHPEILGLFPDARTVPLTKGRKARSTREKTASGEVLLFNYEEAL